jgi:superfamily I DNA and/or RNA helicase
VSFVYLPTSSAIRSFPSKFFYQNLLTDAAEAQALAPISVSGPNGALRTFSPVRFVDLRVGGESPAGKSYVNDTEVTVITRLLSALLPRLDNHSISIITPYKAQVNKLKRALREDRHLSALQYARKRQDGEVEVNSVDGFQGREKDVIIFSAVRSNPRHQGDVMQESADASGRSAYSIGFVADERRLNVAITRAKRLLILVGNAGTLSADGTWRAMYQNLSERGMVKRLAHVSDLGSEGCVFDFLT